MNNYIKRVLSNGVKLYLYPDAKMKKTYVGYSIGYGSSGKWFDFYYNDEKHHVLPGCAHFLEHMLGEHSKYGNIYNYFSSLNYECNAITYSTDTIFYFIGVDGIKDSIKKLIEAIDEPVFTSSDVEETKHAIIEETKRGLNNKHRVALAQYSRDLYKGMDLYHETLSSIGNEVTTEALDYDTLKICYDAFYYDENKTLLVAGNFQEEEMVEYLESIYANIKPHKKEMAEYQYIDLDKIKNKMSVNYLPTSDDYVIMGFKEKFNGFTKKEVYYFINFIAEFKFSDYNDFKTNLKKKDIISSYGGYSSYLYGSEYYDFFICASVKKIDLFIEEVIEYFKKNNLTREDFELYKKGIIADQVVSRDFKYRKFDAFVIKRMFSDDFEDIDFIKSLSYERFNEFYNSLNFDEYVVSVIRDI